jgi:hypothetical protein
MRGWLCRGSVLGIRRKIECALIIPMIIQTILLYPSGAVWTDEAPYVSRQVPFRSAHSDAEHLARNRKVEGSNPSSGSKTAGQRLSPDLAHDRALALGHSFVLGSGASSSALGAVVHLLLSALFGILFALAVPLFGSNGSVALAGTVYGLLLYVVNFLVLAPLAFTTFRMAN